MLLRWKRNIKCPRFKGLRICVTGFDDSELDTSITLKQRANAIAVVAEAVHF